MDRRKDGWTWTKEILGTMVGVIGVLIIPSAWLYNTIDNVKVQVIKHELEIAYLKEAKTNTEKRTDGIDSKLDKILEQVNEIRVKAAGQARP